jgi:hypothetical protein
MGFNDKCGVELAHKGVEVAHKGVEVAHKGFQLAHKGEEHAHKKELEQIADLERENARLRQMIEDSKMMDEVLKTEIIEEGFVPHYNPKTFVTMWTSTDGKKCYYTKESPRSP